MKNKGVKQSQIAKELKVRTSTVHRVIEGTYPAKTAKGQATRTLVQNTIAWKVGRPVEDLFPPGERPPKPKK